MSRVVKGSVFAKCVTCAVQRWDVLRELVAAQAGGEHTTEKAEWVPEVLIDLYAAEGTK
jgi:hypothetical protein